MGVRLAAADTTAPWGAQRRRAQVWFKFEYGLTSTAIGVWPIGSVVDHALQAANVSSAAHSVHSIRLQGRISMYKYTSVPDGAAGGQQVRYKYRQGLKRVWVKVEGYNLKSRLLRSVWMM